MQIEKKVMMKLNRKLAGEFIMTANNIGQQNSHPELKAQDVCHLVSEALQEHFQLDMSNSDYKVQDTFDVFIAAYVERIYR